MNKGELIKLIESLEINTEEYWILSSSALVLRDIFSDAGDLDIAVTEKGLEELKIKYDVKEHPNYSNWYTVSDKIECVLDTKESWKIEKYGKYNLESIDKYLKYLETSTREKDKARIEIVKNYINSRYVKK